MGGDGSPGKRLDRSAIDHARSESNAWMFRNQGIREIASGATAPGDMPGLVSPRAPIAPEQGMFLAICTINDVASIGGWGTANEPSERERKLTHIKRSNRMTGGGRRAARSLLAAAVAAVVLVGVW